MTRPSDRAIAQAFWHTLETQGALIAGTLNLVIDRAAELDATAAPVVVGSDIGNPISGDTGFPVSARWPPDVIAWHDDKTVWLTHRAKRSGTHALVYAVAPVVVGEDAVGRALCAKVPGAWGGTGEWSVTAFINTPSPLFPDITPRDIIRAALTAALSGD